MRRVYRTGTLAAVVALSALIFAGGASAGTITLGEAANGKTVKAKVGDLVRVKLESNASTGYAWEVAGIDAAKLRIAGAIYTPPKAKPPVVGAPGTYMLTLRVRARGRSTLKLEYVGPPRAYTVGERFAVTIVAS